MRVAVIGCGKQAPKHLKGLRGAGLINADLVVADTDAERADNLSQKEGVSAFSLDQIWTDQDIQALIIATPTPTHADLCELAVKSGKAFLCEKPLASSGDEARRLATQADKSRVVGMVGYIYRSVPIFQQVRRLIHDEGVLGPVNLALLRIGGRGSHQVWKHLRKHAGGAINEMLVHTLDLALWLFGAPQLIKLLASELRAPVRVIAGHEEIVDAEDSIVVQLDYDAGGPSVYLQADMLTPAFTQRLEVQGANGTLVASIQQDEPSYLYLSEMHGTRPAGRNPLHHDNDNPYEIQSRTFLDAVAMGKKPEYGSLGEAVLLHELIDELHKQREKFT